MRLGTEMEANLTDAVENAAPARELKEFETNAPTIIDKYGHLAYRSLHDILADAHYGPKVESIIISDRELGSKSDVDVMVVFKDEFSNKEAFEKFKDEIDAHKFGGFRLQHYEQTSKGDLTFWLYSVGHYKGANYPNFECGLPFKPTNADWGPLARILQLEWQATRCKAVYGEDIPKRLEGDLEHIKSLVTPEDGYEFLIIQTRKLAEGIFRESYEHFKNRRLKDTYRESKNSLELGANVPQPDDPDLEMKINAEYESDRKLKDMHLAKAILRSAEALYIMTGNRQDVATEFRRMKEHGEFLFRLSEFQRFGELIGKALYVREHINDTADKEARFELDTSEVNKILAYFGFITEIAKQHMNDERDYPFDQERLDRLEEYYVRNTPALMDILSAAKKQDGDFGIKLPLMHFYLDGMLSYSRLERRRRHKVKKMSNDNEKILREIASQPRAEERGIDSIVLSGKVKFALFDYIGAIKEFEEALQRMKYRGDAAEWFGFMKLNPDYAKADVLKDCGQAYLKIETKNMPKAEEYFEESLKLNPRDADAWYRLARLVEQRDKAKSLCYDAISSSLYGKATITLDAKTSEHRKLFEFWRGQLKNKIREDVQKIESGLQNVLHEYDEERQSKNLDLEYLDNLAILQYKKCAEFKRFLSHQNEVLNVIQIVPVEALSDIEKSYFRNKRLFQDQIIYYDDTTRKVKESCSGDKPQIFGGLLHRIEQTHNGRQPAAMATIASAGILIGLPLRSALPTVNGYLSSYLNTVIPANYIDALLVGSSAVGISAVLWLAHILNDNRDRISAKGKRFFVAGDGRGEYNGG